MKVSEKIGFKVILVVMGLILICSIALQISSFYHMFDLVKSSAEERAELTKSYVEKNVDFTAMKEYLSKDYESAQQESGYIETKTLIRNLKESSGAKFVYISMKSPEDGWIYMADAYTEGDEFYTPLGTPVEAEYLSTYQEIENSLKPIPGDYENGDFGMLFSNYFPVLAEDGTLLAVIGTDFDISREYAQFIKNFIQGLLIALAFLILSAIALWMYVRAMVEKPINTLVEVTKRMADGDMDVRINITKKDEIGVLAKTFQRMALRINDVIATIHTASMEVEAGSNQLLESSTSLSRGVTDQFSSMENLTSSIEEIEQQSTGNAKRAQETNQKAVETYQYAQEGNQQMANLLLSMEAISGSSRQISKVIKMIDDIAFQTNLLALNAAVESARAGKYGKGFAVVAAEVKNLANKSAGAAKETADLIEQSINQVGQGAALANKTSQALQSIVDSVSAVSELVTDIAASSQEQSQGVTQINQELIHISMIVRDTSSVAEETAAASEVLSTQAAKMKATVDTFKLRQAPALQSAKVQRTAQERYQEVREI